MQKTGNKKKISFFAVNEAVRVKTQQQGTYENIMHTDDLKDLFPD